MHMVNDISLLDNPQPFHGRVNTAGEGTMEIRAMGDADFNIGAAQVRLKDVLYVPDLNVKLLSTIALTDEGARVLLEHEGGKIFFPDGALLRARINRKKNWLEVREGSGPEDVSALQVTSLEQDFEDFRKLQNLELFEGVPAQLPDRVPSRNKSEERLWHERLGHPGRDKARALMEKFKSVPDFKINPDESLECHDCLTGKSTRSRMGKGSGERAQNPLELIHVDLVTDIAPEPEEGTMLVILDDYSGYVHIDVLQRKSDALRYLQEWVKLMEVQTGRELKAIRSDNGGEWASHVAHNWKMAEGFIWQKTAPYNSVQNGRVERMNRSVQERMRALLGQRELNVALWPFAAKAAAFVLNLTPNKEGFTPYELAFKKSPLRFTKLLKVFGSLAWVFLPKPIRGAKTKAMPRAIPAIMLGYSLERKCWLFFSPDNNPTLFWSNSAKFLEHQGWQDRTDFLPIKINPPKRPTDDADIPDLCYDEEDIHDELYIDAIEHTLPPPEDFDEELVPTEEIKQTVEQTESKSEQTESADEQVIEEELDEEPYDVGTWRPVPSFNHKTGEPVPNPWREKYPEKYNERLDAYLRRKGLKRLNALLTNISKKEELNLTPTLREALGGDNVLQWKEAIRKEIEGLEAMGTWEVVDKPKDAHLVDSKMVLKIKTDADLVPTKHKARLVARGFTQRYGVDFEEIFAPVAPLETIRSVLAIATVNDWEIDSIDVVQAYLNSKLHHDVYLKPPEGLSVPEGKVYKLVKGLYGLKQSGREWNKELDKFLRSVGFFCLSCAPCLYTRGKGDNFAIITTYVDDILVTSPSRSEVDRIKESFKGKWSIEDNGPVKEFLGIKITRNRANRTLDLDQVAYIKTLVGKWLKNNQKTWCPMVHPLEAKETPELSKKDAENYRKVVGQLLWISNTVRPDISFAVGSLARYMSTPRQGAWTAAVQVLKYLNQTAENVLRLGNRKDMDQPVVTYTDANWASEKETGRRSTSGSMTFIYGSLVSWKSQGQKCVSLSALESEFVAASEASRELLFFKHLLRELGLSDKTPLLLTDSLGCVQVSKDAAKHWKLKHIDTRYNFVRDHVQAEEIEIRHIGTKDNLADILTKPVSKITTTKASIGAGLVRSARGTVEDSAPTDPPVEVGELISEDLETRLGNGTKGPICTVAYEGEGRVNGEGARVNGKGSGGNYAQLCTGAGSLHDIGSPHVKVGAVSSVTTPHMIRCFHVGLSAIT